MYVSLQKEVNFTAKERSLVSILYRHAGPVTKCRYVAAAWGKLQLSGFRKWDNTTGLSFLTNATNATPILLDPMIWGSTCWHMSHAQWREAQPMNTRFQWVRHYHWSATNAIPIQVKQVLWGTTCWHPAERRPTNEQKSCCRKRSMNGAFQPRTYQHHP